MPFTGVCTLTLMKKGATLVLATSLLIAAPLQQAQASAFEKAKFVFHLGVAAYAFNHWVWQPYRTYKFKQGAPGQRTAVIKAGVALVFAATQVNAAIKMTQNSADPFLKNIGGLLPDLSKTLATVGANLQNGKFDEAGIQKLNTATTNLLDQAQQQGHPIRPVAAPIPGL